MKNLLLLLSVFLGTVNISFSQSSDNSWISLPEGFGFSNQIKYSSNSEKIARIFENWTNLDYIKGIFSAGIRFEVFQPNNPDPSISRGKEFFADIAYKYLTIDLSNYDYGIKLTAGNFYELFGRGMVIKSYEDRNVRVDNNFLGFKANAYFKDFYLSAFSGSAANSNNLREDIVHAIDLSYSEFNFLKTGLTYAINIPQNKDLSKTSLTSIRFVPSISNFDFYFEFGVKQNDEIRRNFLGEKEKIIGKGFYGNLSNYWGPFSLSAEYKIYDNYLFSSSDQTISYNTPPALRKDYTYVLLNSNPSPLNANNEQGYQIELNYTLNDETNFQTNFLITNSLNENSYYQRINKTKLPVETQLKEYYFQAFRKWSDSFNSIFVFGYSEENSSKTKNLTPIIENKFHFDDINTIRVIIEHQHTTNIQTDEKYFSNVFSIEYLRSPSFNLNLLTEMQTRENLDGKLKRKFWSFIQLGYKISNHTDLSILLGSRQTGNICSGGVCRFEPEFKGIEVKMFTRL